MTPIGVDDPSASGGTWSEAGGTFRIHDRMGTGGCSAGDEGVYTYVHGASCATVTMTLVTDPCTGRAMSLGGAVFTRIS